jgi:hypothetical protein
MKLLGQTFRRAKEKGHREFDIGPEGRRL